MLVKKSDGTVVASGGLQDQKTFQIRTNGHAFRMLSSGLYSDKIAAVVREIGCNASDAHIAKGIPHKPIEVKLPNSIDPQFYIKDYGIGLGHDDVMGLYTTYFASTKQQSNEMTGAFGLGSKSPFSYTDSFSVTACKDGVRRIYSAHIGEDDTPTVALMHEEKIPKNDEWQSGVMVGFPVKKEDTQEFHKRAQQVYKFFPTPPEIIGGDPIFPLEITQDYTSFAFVENLPHHIVAVMGGVMYPIRPHDLNLPYSHELRHAVECMTGVMLRVPIGSVQVAASREQLQFDESTRKYLINELEKVIAKVADDICTKARACKTWAERCDFTKTSKNTRGIHLSAALLAKLGHKDAEQIMDMYSSHVWALPLPMEGVRQLTIIEHPDSSPNNPSIGFKIKIGRAEIDNQWRNRISFTPDVTIVWGNETRPTVRIKEALRTKALTGTIILLCQADFPRPNKTAMQKSLKALEDSLPGVLVRNLADFEAPPLKKHSKSKKKAAVFHDGEILFQGKLTKVTDVPPEKRLYMRITAGGPRSTDKMHMKNGDLMINPHYGYVRSAVLAVNKYLQKDWNEPCLLRISDIKRVDINRRPDWTHYEDFISQQLSDPAFQKALVDFVGSYKYTVNLKAEIYDHLNGGDFLDILVWFRAKPQYWGQHFKDVVEKHGMLDIVNEIYKNSKLPAVAGADEIERLISHVSTLCQYSGVVFTLPVVTGRDISTIADKLTGAKEMSRYEFIELIKAYPKSFSTILDEIITRGE